MYKQSLIIGVLRQDMFRVLTQLFGIVELEPL